MNEPTETAQPAPAPPAFSRRRLMGPIFTILSGTVVMKLLGFARDAGLAARFGLGGHLDAFNAAQLLPVVLVGLLVGEGGGRIAILFVPLYTEVRARSGAEAAWRFTLTIFNLCLLVLALLSLLMIALPGLSVRIMAPGFEGERATLASQMLLILAASTVGMGLAGFMRGYMIARERYLLVTLAPAIASVLLVVYVLGVAPRQGIEGVAWVTLAASFLPVILQLPSFLASGGGYRPVIHWSDPAVRRIGRLFVPIAFGLSLNQLGAFVDQVMASLLPAGHLSALTYANRLRGIPFFLFILSTEQAVFPRMCSEFTARGIEGLRDMAHFSMRVMTALTLPAVVGMLVLREPVARLTFGHGAVDQEGVHIIAGALGFYLLGLFALCIATVLGNVFFALQDSRTPTILASIALGVNIVGNLLLIRPMQANGIALATSISAVCYQAMCAWFLRRRVPGLLGREMGGMYARTLAAALVMAAVCELLMHRVWQGGATSLSVRQDLVRLLAVSAAGAVAYVAAAVALRVDGARLALGLLRERASRSWR